MFLGVQLLRPFLDFRVGPEVQMNPSPQLSLRLPNKKKYTLPRNVDGFYVATSKVTVAPLGPENPICPGGPRVPIGPVAPGRPSRPVGP